MISPFSVCRCCTIVHRTATAGRVTDPLKRQHTLTATYENWYQSISSPTKTQTHKQYAFPRSWINEIRRFSLCYVTQITPEWFACICGHGITAVFSLNEIGIGFHSESKMNRFLENLERVWYPLCLWVTLYFAKNRLALVRCVAKDRWKMEQINWAHDVLAMISMRREPYLPTYHPSHAFIVQ